MVKVLFLIFIALFILDGMIIKKNQQGVLAQDNNNNDGGYWSEVSFRKRR
uniref:Uncharacterized protein n=1 Tax=Meloidogyne enterolobii TaxID=390850 RepID=A0A6V7VQI1_MELEN|nr:unnamed protein product [Meloidogyne enterolobii]